MIKCVCVCVCVCVRVCVIHPYLITVTKSSYPHQPVSFCEARSIVQRNPILQHNHNFVDETKKYREITDVPCSSLSNSTSTLPQTHYLGRDPASKLSASHNKAKYVATTGFFAWIHTNSRRTQLLLQ